MKYFKFLLFLLWVPAAWGELVIEITKGVDNPTSIAIVPFAWSGSGFLPEDLTRIVSDDLSRTGLFAVMDERDMPLSRPHRPEDIVYSDWRKYGVEYIVIGRVEPKDEKGGFRVHFDLFEIHGQTRLFTRSVSGSDNALRDLAHYVSDKIYETLTGFRGHFSTQIVYVQAVKVNGEDRFQLFMSDQDGARVQKLVDSDEPILSPTWSPDAKEVAYVSFENRRPAIFRQVLATGERRKLTSFEGLNSAPAWSPDGKKMAMVLSKDGNPELYLMELSSGRLKRLTNHFAIDTEPSWWPDGKSLVFTSNRGGRPQIYRYFIDSGQLERVTFEGDYNARARVTPDEKHLVMVHRRKGVFHIAVQDFVTGQIHVLTKTDLDESPTLAPNGRMVMYATKENKRGILAAVSLDGGVKVRLPSQQGDVREPVWSPFR